jgi:signal transduction histidine kinase
MPQLSQNESLFNRVVNWFFAARWRVLTTLFIALALPCGIIVFFIEFHLGQELEQRVVDQNQKLIESKVKMVEEHMFGLIKYAEAYAQHEVFANNVQERLVGQKRLTTFQQISQRVNHQLKEIVTNHHKIDFAFITDTSGTLFYDYPIDTTVYGQNFAYRDWYKGVATRGTTYVSEIYQRAASGKPFVVTVVTPLYHSENEQILGYFGIQHPIDKFLEFLKGVEGSSGQLMLIDQNGNLPLVKEEGGKHLKNISSFPALQSLSAQQGAKKMTDPLLGEKCMVNYSTAQSLGWTVFSSYPLYKIQRPINILQILFITVIGIAFLILFLLAFAWFDMLRRYHLESERHQNQIAVLNDQLEGKVEKLKFVNKELKSFTHSVSHDLQSPLRAIYGYSQILMEDHKEKLSSEVKELLDVIQSNTTRMSQLIQDLLEFSRIGRREVDKKRVNMSKIVQEILNEQQREYSKKVKLTLQELPEAKGDPDMLRQVWGNLISNAFKYTSKEEHPHIEIGAKQNDKRERTIYYVRDNGVGFDMDYAGKLFDVFQRLHSRKEFKGTGVGLALVQRIVHKHGGEIWAEAQKNQGATFYFYLN